LSVISYDHDVVKIGTLHGSRSLMMLFGSPQYFTTFLKNSRAASSVVQSVWAGINVAYFENRSTITRIEPNPSDFGKAEIKSRDTLSQGLSGEGRGF
ncbi:hypothetical protein PIB30_096592, partial [Stylosanthes scabra]|nr:hypothetical protein [Stylosanthes scabra]